MKTRAPLFFVVLLTLLAAVSPPPLTASDEGLGIIALNLEDPSRPAWDGKGPRPVLTHLFYPTRSDRAQPLLLGAPGEPLFDAGPVVWNGEPALAEPRPLILLSHGTGGSALQMVWLARVLVDKGFLVAGVNHHGNTAIEKFPQGFMLWWERPADLGIALRELEANEKWGKWIDAGRVGVVGFSLGGYTAASAVGALTDRSLYEAFCAGPHRDFTCEPQREFLEIREEFDKVAETPAVRASMARQKASHTVEGIRAAFLIAPAVTQALTPESLGAISVPVRIVVGSNDRVAPGATNGRHLADSVPGSAYSEIEHAGHYTFLEACTELGRKVLGDLCADHPSIDRRAIHQQVAGAAARFFEESLATNSP